MVIQGVLVKSDTGYSALCRHLGAFGSGKTKARAFETLRAAIRTRAAANGEPAHDFEIRIEDDGETIWITSDKPGRLLSALLRHQRAKRGMSIADVANKLGVKSRNSYAVYETGNSDPSVSKLQELLGVLAPELAVTIGTSAPPTKAELEDRATSLENAKTLMEWAQTAPPGAPLPNLKKRRKRAA